MLGTVIEFLSKNTKPEEVIFCLYDEMALSVFENTLDQLAAKKH